MKSRLLDFEDHLGETSYSALGSWSHRPSAARLYCPAMGAVLMDVAARENSSVAPLQDSPGAVSVVRRLEEEGPSRVGAACPDDLHEGRASPGLSCWTTRAPRRVAASAVLPLAPRRRRSRSVSPAHPASPAGLRAPAPGSPIRSELGSDRQGPTFPSAPSWCGPCR